MKILNHAKKVLNSRFGLMALGLVFAAATLILIFSTWVWNWKFGLPATADKTARINTVVAVSAYIAALVGVVVALIAYWQASGRPVLVPEITLPSRPPNKLAFEVTKLEGAYLGVHLERVDLRLYLDQPTLSHALAPIFDQPLFGTVVIKNVTKYAARNPGIRITFDGLYYTYLIPQGWTVAESWPNQTKTLSWPKAIQWDGGTDNIIHGKWSRTLPDNIAFTGVIFTRPDPKLILTVVADGCEPQDWSIPIELFLSNKRPVDVSKVG